MRTIEIYNTPQNIPANPKKGAGTMRKLTYYAIFEPTQEGYGVYFPDLPGCISFGKDFGQAQRNATEALGLHIYGMERDGDEIPEPSKKPHIDPETAGGYIMVPISVFPKLRNESDNRAVKTSVTMPAWLKELAEAQGVDFSKVLLAALMEYLDIRVPR
jgi:predicted RNase H-like HicB family nuclease